MLSERLKGETRAEHEAIERSLSVLMSPELTRERYGGVVAGFYGFFAGWEPRALAAMPGGELLELFRERSKTAQLADDLRALGFDQARIEAIPLCTGEASVPASSLPEVFGTMYVTEGSTLGGQIIAARLEKQLGLTNDKGYMYFRGAGARTMPRWRAFKAILDSAVPPDAHDRAVASARDTFTKLQAWLAR